MHVRIQFCKGERVVHVSTLQVRGTPNIKLDIEITLLCPLACIIAVLLTTEKLKWALTC